MKLSSTEHGLLVRAARHDGPVEYAGLSEGAAVDTLVAVGFLTADDGEYEADFGRRGRVEITELGRQALEVAAR